MPKRCACGLRRTEQYPEYCFVCRSFTHSCYEPPAEKFSLTKEQARAAKFSMVRMPAWMIERAESFNRATRPRPHDEADQLPDPDYGF